LSLLPSAIAVLPAAEFATISMMPCAAHVAPSWIVPVCLVTQRLLSEAAPRMLIVKMHSISPFSFHYMFFAPWTACGISGKMLTAHAVWHAAMVLVVTDTSASHGLHCAYQSFTIELRCGNTSRGSA
jgi:hypothetical protein